jgi:hypothetical protein
VPEKRDQYRSVASAVFGRGSFATSHLDAETILASLTSDALALLHRRRPKELDVRRDIWTAFDEFLSSPDHTFFVIADVAGAGKTWFLAQAARELVERGTPIAALSGSMLPQGGPELASSNLIERALTSIPSLKIALKQFETALSTLLKQRVRDEAALDLNRLDAPSCARLWEALDSAAQTRGGLVMLLDGINEFYGARNVLMASLEAFLDRQLPLKHIKVVLTVRYETWARRTEPMCRLFDPPEGERYQRLYRSRDITMYGQSVDHGSAFLAGAGNRDMGVYADSEFAAAWTTYATHYHVKGHPARSAQRVLKNPLLLQYFCDAFKGQDVGEFTRLSFQDVICSFVNGKRDSIVHRLIDRYGGGIASFEETARIARDTILRFAWSLYVEHTAKIPFMEASRRFSEWIPNDAQFQWLRDAEARHRESLLLRAFLEEGLLETNELKLCGFAFELYFEYCLGRYIGRHLLGPAPEEISVARCIQQLVEGLTGQSGATASRFQRRLSTDPIRARTEIHCLAREAPGGGGILIHHGRGAAPSNRTSIALCATRDSARDQGDGAFERSGERRPTER